MDTHIIRAIYDDQTIRVYQAYPPEIGLAAVRAGRLVPPFRMERMTWIKPSFNWMMYRSGFATKSGQEIVLGIDITREGFEWALAHAALSHFDRAVHGSHEAWQQSLLDSPVQVQWDPERDFRLQPMAGVRSIQIGLSREAVAKYVHEWTIHIEDVTGTTRRIAREIAEGLTPKSRPDERERPYPMDRELLRRAVPLAPDALK
jgi:hypothetical protein